MLLVGGLAEHILLELSSRFASIDEDIFEKEDIDSMKANIFILMIAAGQEGDLVPGQRRMESMTIRNILSSFSVGTENRKSMNIGPPDPTKIGAVKNLPSRHLESVESKIMKQMEETTKFRATAALFVAPCASAFCAKKLSFLPKTRRIASRRAS